MDLRVQLGGVDQHFLAAAEVEPGAVAARAHAVAAHVSFRLYLGDGVPRRQIEHVRLGPAGDHDHVLAGDRSVVRLEALVVGAGAPEQLAVCAAERADVVARRIAPAIFDQVVVDVVRVDARQPDRALDLADLELGIRLAAQRLAHLLPRPVHSHAQPDHGRQAIRAHERRQRRLETQLLHQEAIEERQVLLAHG